MSQVGEEGLQMKIVRNVAAMAAVAAALSIAGQARADTIDFYLSTEEGGATAPSPQIEVIVSTWTSNTFTTLATGSSDFASVEFVAPSGKTIDTPVYINVSGTFTATTNLPGGVTGPGGGATFGTMDLGTAANEGDADVYIYLTSTSGGWLDAAAVLMATTGYSTSDYSHGFDAEQEGSSADCGNTQCAGYYAATPLPAALPLFTSVLGTMGLLGWRRKRKAQALAA
jgi:hypothetical protein